MTTASPTTPCPARRRLAAALACLLLLGAAPPEIVRLRVPADQVSKWFPAAEEIRGLAPAAFDELVRGAREGLERRSRRAPPRLLLARHVVRWESGVLYGRSELVVEPSAEGAAELVLDPWTPAIREGGAQDVGLRARPDGRTALRVEAGRQATHTVEWELRARPASDGRGFALGLPPAGSGRLLLDLPEGLTPEGSAGSRRGPLPGPGSGRVLWQFDPAGGSADLRLRGRAGAEGPGSRLWVSGPTRVDLTEAAANWRVDWDVIAGPHAPRQLTVELDPGLELIDVSGPDVESYRAEPRGAAESGSRIAIGLAESLRGATRISVRALAKLPPLGVWSIPSARPLDATWTGGTTVVRLDPGRVVQDCRERDGRRVAGRAEQGEAGLLTFEAHAPGPVAELVFRKPWADVSAEVRGEVLLGNSAPRLEARVTYRVHRGRLLDPEIDLPAAWVPDRVGLAGRNEPVAWHPEIRPDGAVRVRVLLPSGDWSDGAVTLEVAASASISGGRGPILLPRVRPRAGRVVDEVWVARAEPGLTLRPVSARGLAWVDPSVAAAEGPRVPPAAGSWQPALAWRWVDDDGEARVERGRLESEPTADVRLLAAVDGPRLRLDWHVAISASDEPTRSVPLFASGPAWDASGWRFTERPGGLPVPSRPLGAARRASLGFPATGGTAFELLLPQPRRGPFVLRARAEAPWSGRGELPLLATPRPFALRGIVAILAGRGELASVRLEGLRRLDPGVAAALAAPEAHAEGAEKSPGDWGGYRPVHACGYSAPGGRLELRTEGLETARTPGLIREAILTTSFYPSGPARQHLTLHVMPDLGRTLGVTLPEGATLLQVRRDGQAVVPLRSGRGLSIPLPGQRAKGVTTVVLDYLTFTAKGTLLRPERPEFSFPCLSLCWEITAPEAWEVEEVGPALLAADPAPERGWWAGLRRGLWHRLRRWGAIPADPTSSAAMLRALDERVASAGPEEISLGEWLARLDATPWPLIVDRMALASSGLGPRSRFVPRRGALTTSAAASALAAIGLEAVPVGPFLLLSTAADAPSGRGASSDRATSRASWEAALWAAAERGCDPSDRFQSVARWRGEVTPKGRTEEEGGGREAPGPGRRVWRFVASGWPVGGAEVRLVDGRSRLAWAWVAGLVAAAAGVAGGGRLRGWRAAALALAASAAIGCAAFGPARVGPPAMAAAAGLLIGPFYWVGRSLARPPRTRGGAGSAERPRAGSSPANPAMYLAFLLAGLAARAASAERGAEPPGPILALLPFEGAPDTNRAPERVILRLTDFERLQEWASWADGSPEGSEVRALSASHRVERRSDLEALVTSEFGLIVEGDGPARWEVPVENARETSATIDGAPAPLPVEGGGQTAVVRISGPGRRTLRVVRRVSLQPEGPGPARTLTLRVNPVASARLSVEGASGADPAQVPTARGPMQSVGGRVEGLLGPSDRIEIRWPGPARPDGEARSGVVEGVLLWDAEPAGDRLRAKLTYRGAKGTSSIRIGLGPGLLLRSAELPGLVDEALRAGPERSEWSAIIDPPLADGGTVRLEFWRPAQPGPSSGGGEPIRKAPWIEPQGVERYSGVIGYRRPPDWLGRLPSASGVDPMTEEAFVRAWGKLPDEPLTLSGVSRFVRPPAMELPTGPPPDRLSVRSSVSLAIEPGRLAMRVDAELSDLPGRSHHAELDPPAGFRIDRVSGDGLTDWSREPSGRIRLRFDGPAAPQRRVQVVGWVPTTADPLSTGDRGHDMATPWPRWPGVSEEPGTLRISAPSPFRIEPAGSLAPLPADAPGDAPARRAEYRAAYRVNRADAPGRLVWADEPPRVGVLVESQLTVLPDGADWVAVVQYDVSGGGEDSIHLKLPEAWARDASVSLVGQGHRRHSERRGGAEYWTIRPEHAMWGSQRLVIRSSLPRKGRGPIDFPDLVPLGQGLVDTYLSAVNATGRDMGLEGSAGLQPIDDPSHFGAPEFGPALPGGFANRYRVLKEGWGLKLQVSDEPVGADGDAGPARIGLADLSCELQAGDGLVGLARYQVDPHSGPFLPVRLPPGAELLWAAVGEEPVRARRVPESGEWRIALEDAAGGDVCLVWRAGGAALGGGARLPLPRAGDPLAHTPTLLTVASPRAFAVRTGGGRSFEVVAWARLEVERTERLGRAIAENLARFDRGSLRAREALAADLVRFELGLRSAERAIFWGPVASGDPLGIRARALRDRLRIARAGLDEALGNAALEEFDRAARTYLGAAGGAGGSESVAAIPEAAAPLRLRPLGQTASFSADVRGDAPPAPMVERAEQGRLGLAWAPAALGMLACAGLWFAAVGAAKARPRLAWATLSLALGLVAFGLGPGPLVGATALAILGWLPRPEPTLAAPRA